MSLRASSVRTRLGVESLEGREVPATVVSVAATDALGSEAGQDSVAFAVTRSGDQLDRGLWVRLAYSGTLQCNDVTGGTYWVNFAPGQTVANVTLTPKDDARAEGRETVQVQVMAGCGYEVAGGLASATITDNDQLPVLMVIANRDFYYQEYADTRAGLEAAGATVHVAAATQSMCVPHANSGQGANSGNVMPDLAITDAVAANYSAIVFVGGWGSSSYQYAFSGTYYNSAYNGSQAVEQATNALIADFVHQDKYVTAICHGVSVLAWARVDGASPIAGRTVSAYGLSAPNFDGAVPSQLSTRWHVESNGATMVASRSVGNPYTASDDVVVDGKIITAENFDSAYLFGQTIANYLIG